MEIIDIIQRKAYRPISHYEQWFSKNSVFFKIYFEDGSTVIYEDNVGGHIWASILQNLQYEPITGDTSHCVVSPLDYFVLLGFRAGDAVLFRFELGIEQPILFS